MESSRRMFLFGLAALAAAGPARSQRLKVVNPRQQAIASLWPALDSAPFIRPARVLPGVITTCYMFTNKNCPRCQAFHRQNPRGFSGLDMRYLIMPWSGEDPQELNFLYSDRSEASYIAYMARNLSVSRTARYRNQVPMMAALSSRVGDTLITGGVMGTPYFLFRIFDKSDNSVIFVAGSILDDGVKRLFDVSA